METIIRPIKRSEMAALLELYRHLHADDADAPEETALELAWNEILSDPKIRCLVADLDGGIVASCILIIMPNLTRGARPYALIENVVTHAKHRKQGIGSQILKHALQIAWNARCYKVMLLTGSKREDVHRFYEKAGFKKGIKTGFVATPTSAFAAGMGSQ